jgi:hypothetical protein
MKKKQYLYAISFWFTDNEGRSGQSCSLITRPSKIDTINDFNNMSDYLREHNQFRTIAICNIMLLGKVKV